MSVKRWGGLVLGCLGLLLSLNAQAVQDPKSITIGLSLPHLANPWYIEAKAGMEKACTELGIKCVAIDAHNSVEKQHDDIQGMIDGQYDAILASALDMGNLTSLYAKAKKQGIITASLAQTIPHSDLYYKVDEHGYGYEIGAQAANWAKKNLKCKAKVALITQDNLVTVKARGNGAERALKQICPEIEIVARYHADDPYRGMNVMDWILPSHPDLNMVVTTTDASAIGSYLALQVNEISGKDIAVFSGDATQDALHMIAEDNSVFRGTVNLYPFQGGYDSVMRLYEMVQNGAPAFPKFETLPYTALSQEQVRSGDYERSF